MPFACRIAAPANTTNAESKALGYSIYYTLVNLGGAIGPLIALQVRRSLGIEYVLLTSALTAVALFVGAFLFFREPERSEDAGPPRSLTQVLLDLGTVIRNQRFVLFLVIKAMNKAMPKPPAPPPPGPTADQKLLTEIRDLPAKR